MRISTVNLFGLCLFGMLLLAAASASAQSNPTPRWACTAPAPRLKSERAQESAPAEWAAWGAVLLQSGSETQGLQQIRESFQRQPDNLYARYYIALTALKDSDVNSARKLLYPLSLTPAVQILDLLTESWDWTAGYCGPAKLPDLVSLLLRGTPAEGTPFARPLPELKDATQAILNDMRSAQLNFNNRTFKRAVVSMTNAIERGASSPAMECALASVEYLAGSQSVALDRYVELVKKNQDNTAILRLAGLDLLTFGNYSMTEMVFKKILILAPDDYRSKLNLAAAYAMMPGRDMEALRLLQEIPAPSVTKRYPDWFQAQFPYVERMRELLAQKPDSSPAK